MSHKPKGYNEMDWSMGCERLPYVRTKHAKYRSLKCKGNSSLPVPVCSAIDSREETH